MDIYQQLQKEHDQVRKTMEAITKTSARSIQRRTDQFDKLVDLLTPHMSGEEQTLYEELLQRKQSRSNTLEAIEEHNAARIVLNELSRLAKEDEVWIAKFKVLHDLLEHHIEEEETELFNLARDEFSDEQANDVLRRYNEIKKKIQSGQPTPRARRAA